MSSPFCYHHVFFNLFLLPLLSISSHVHVHEYHDLCLLQFFSLAMRNWLQYISFSSPPPSSSSSSSSVSASPTSFSTGDDQTLSLTQKSSNSSSRVTSLGLRLGVGAICPKLIRSRKLRHLTDEELSSPGCSSVYHQQPESTALSRSPSSRFSSSRAVPLPLPLPLRENPNPADVDVRLSSAKERDRERVAGAGEGLSSSNSPIPSICVSRDARRNGEHLDTRSTTMMRTDFGRGDSSQDNFRINVPARSAPTSPFASPVLSPERTNGNADSLAYSQIIAKANQVWSAPEMATLDVLGLPPPAFFDCSAVSIDNSPLHSPPNRSPCRKARSPSQPASPLNAKAPNEISTTRRESNANLEVHRLPLPPGAAVLSPSTPVPMGMLKLESTSMKSQWLKGKLIGRGTFGSVYVASNRETGALCAMKEVELFPDDPKSTESIKQLAQEIKVLSQLKHPNIVQYYGSEIVEDRFYIYLEYVHPGSINKYVREHYEAITERVVRSFTRHILSGLAYLHSMKTIHRDIKGANLLVDASGVVKLADFGMAKHLTGQAADLSLKGSPYWMAPELMQAVMQKETNSDLALAVDIWSLGCTIIEMFTGKPPWSEYEGAAAMFKVMRDSPPVPEDLSHAAKDFLRCCFRRNPAERPSASKLLEHRWLQNSQQLDFMSSTQVINGIKLTDMSHSPRISEVKLDQLQLPVFPSAQSTRGKMPSESSSFANSSFCQAGMTNDIIMKLPT